MLSRMPAQELTDWAAYEDLTGPLDYGHRADIHAGIIAATIANANRGKKGKRSRPEDFMPQWGGKRQQTPEEQLRIVEQLNAALGGRDLRGQS